MSDPRSQLSAKFQPATRYSNFSSALKSITVQGFRGIADLTIDFQYPITAISGLNGAGKSTVGQLCLGAYKKPTTLHGYKRFYVRDFFPASTVDPNPFTQDSSVRYSYNTNEPASPQVLTVARTSTEWSGYKRQPERACYYIGFTIYIPKVEQRDLSVYGGTRLTLANQRSIPANVRERVGRILGQPYDQLHFQEFTHGHRRGEIGIASRFGAAYSENNMGFGEGRTLYLVDLMENSPEQSLFVIEEPETSLHENAQFELGKYLIDVCNRRHHQIILTTHSHALLSCMPPEARLLLLRDRSGVGAFHGLSASRVRSILSEGSQRELSVLVEDDFAKLLLTEMIRRVDPGLLRAVHIHQAGDTNAVRQAAFLLRRLSKPYVAIRDGDIGPSPADGIYSFPGSRPPEKEVFESNTVRETITRSFRIDIGAILHRHGVTDHHKIAQILAAEASTPTDHLCIVAINAYLDEVGIATIAPLVQEIHRRA
jgi:predicted ATPase